MPINVERLEPAQRNSVIHVSEGHYSDIKSIDIRPSRLTEAISAFANADGGELYVGIEEVGNANERKWRGFSDVEAANAHIQVCEQLFPLGRDFSYTFLSCDDEEGLVLKIEILKTMGIMRATDGHPYLRRGAQSLKISTSEQLKRLEYAKGLVSFESEPVPIEPDYVCNSTEIIE